MKIYYTLFIQIGTQHNPTSEQWVAKWKSAINREKNDKMYILTLKKYLFLMRVS